MKITVNGQALAGPLPAIRPQSGRAEGSLGEALAAADDLLEKAGSVIVSFKVDGVAVDADSYERIARLRTEYVDLVEILAESSSAIRIRTLETLLELLSLSRLAATETEEEEKTDWPGIRAGAQDIRDAFAGLFAADELSFVQLFVDLLAKAGDEPDFSDKAAISSQAERLGAIFSERLAELREPIAEMRSAAALFGSQEGELGELPVYLQTGKEDRAMKAVLYFIETFNKVIRLIPELRRAGIDTDALRIDGQDLATFYGSFNEVLRKLTEAFEHKDSVLIGDLAEYEVLPRMKNFFGAMDGALPPS